MCLKNTIFVSECLEDVCLVTNESNMYLGDDEAKELVIICDHVHFSHKSEWTQTAFSLLKGQGHDETHVRRSCSLLTVSGGVYDLSTDSRWSLGPSSWLQ